MIPRVSVLLPVRNGGPALEAALDSLRLQSLADFELVIIDDGSTDETPDRLRAAAREDTRIRLFTQPAHGLFAALTRGLAESRAPLIARMDADDTCHLDRLSLQVRRMDQAPELGVLACRVHFGGTGAGYARHVEWINSLETHEQMALVRFRESPLAHPSVMFRRSCVERFGGYRDGPFPEDYELWLRWFEAGVRFEKLPESLLDWNDSPGRLSRTHPSYSVDAFYKLKFPYLARWLAQNNPRHPHVIIVGAGRVTRRRVDALRSCGVVVDAWADLDPRKIGKVYDGIRVIAHEAIPASAFVVSCVGRIGAATSIAAMLEKRGFRRGRTFIEAA